MTEQDITLVPFITTPRITSNFKSILLGNIHEILLLESCIICTVHVMNPKEPQQTDEEIIRLVQAGDKEKFGIIMERYASKLSRYGRKFLSDPDNIEDIVQDVFVRAFKNINGFNSALKFSSWIYRIAHNAFVNGLRQKQRNPLLFIDFDTFIPHQVYEDPAVDEKEHEKMKKMIELGLESLSPKYKEVIILHYLEEISYKEISDILEIPVGTVGIRVMRGKKMLREFYQSNNITYGE